MKKIIIRFNAPVILSFALLSLIALLLGNWTSGAATTQYFSVYRSSLADPLTYVRFFGHVLGHSGYDHYMGNMLLLLLVGPGLEEKYGSGTMVWMIALTALVTGLVNFIFFPHTALLGASGVVFMMIVLSSFTAARKGEIPVTLILVVIFYLGGISNQWDRLRRGSVTDYLQFPHRKAKKRALVWNLADFMLIGGVVNLPNWENKKA